MIFYSPFLFSVAKLICISIVNARQLTRVIQVVLIYSYWTNYGLFMGKILLLSSSNYSSDLILLEIFSNFSVLKNLLKFAKHLTNLVDFSTFD